MKPPGLVASVIGANIVFVGIGMALAVFGWLFFTTGEHFWWLFTCLMAGHFSYRANAKVRAYRQWQREWQGMSGEGPRPIRLPRLGGLRIVVALAAWLFAAWFAITEGDDPNLRIPVVMFWIGTALAVALQARSWLRRAFSGDRTVVLQLLGRPIQSPRGSGPASVLPSYCHAVLGPRNQF